MNACAADAVTRRVGADVAVTDPGERGGTPTWTRWALRAAIVVLGLAAIPAMRVHPTPNANWTVQTLGLPALYATTLPGGGTAQCYLDPGLPGFNGVHATFFDASGHELALDGPVIVRVTGRGGIMTTLPVLREGPGHFYTDFAFGAGSWRIDITATTATGSVLKPAFTVHL